jgi:hypothetical protein
MDMPVVLSFGMGLDGAAIIGEWLSNPASRDFDLQDLVVISAQPGGEGAETKRQIEQHILPLFRRHHIRYVQVARAGPSLRDGYVVLDDSRKPATLHTTGRFFTLYDEMVASGTVPQYASGKRTCSDKFKGVPISQWLKHEFGDQRIRHVFGYAADEQKRIARARQFEDSRGLRCRYEFPLRDWGWDRAACAARSVIFFDEEIVRSCCAFCPFAAQIGSKQEMLERYRRHPAEAATTLLMEHLAIALNPRMALYPGGRRCRDLVQHSGNVAALRQYRTVLATTPWALYHVERIYHRPGMTDRRLTTLTTGDEAAVTAALYRLAGKRQLPVQTDAHDVTPRIYVRQRGDGYPALEEMYVIGPALAQDKSRKRFAGAWAEHTRQLRMF